MKIFKQKVELESAKQVDFIDITEEVAGVVEKSEIKSGLVTVFSPHTTAGIVINQNESMLIQDLSRLLYRLAPIDERYSHDIFEITKQNKSDGRSNGHSHCKNLIIGCSQTIPLDSGSLLLGQKQNIFFVDLDGSRKRDYVIQIMGE